MERPFETSYPGIFNGHAKTREGAIMAAMSHVVRDGYNRATITDKRTGVTVARVIVNADRTSCRVELNGKAFRKLPR